MKDQDRCERSHVPSPDPSRACPLDDLVDDNGPSNTGDPKQREWSQVPSPSPSHAHPSGDIDDDDDDPFDSDAGDPKLWDLHAGLKPSPLDEEASDGEDDIEGDLPYGGAKEVNSMMIDMMVELSDCDEGDMEWLPASQRKKVEARKKGIVSFRDANVRKTYHAIRKEKDPLPWARYCLQVGTNATTAPPCPRDEESDKTHRAYVHQVLVSVTPSALASLIEGCVEGCVGGVISRAVDCPIPIDCTIPVDRTIPVDPRIPGAISRLTFLMRFLTCFFGIAAAGQPG